MSERTLYGFVTKARKAEWPEKPSAEHRLEVGQGIVKDVLLEDSPSWYLLYYLTEAFRTLPTDSSLLTGRANIGLGDEELFHSDSIWYPGYWFAQYLSDGIAEAWESSGRSLEQLEFIFEFDHDGPEGDYLTMSLEVRNTSALEAWLKESGMSEEERRFVL